MQAIILAAGMGKRLGEYTRDNTKCMLPVNGRPLIDRTLDMLANLGIRRVVIVVGYQAQNLIDYIGQRYADRLDIEYVNNPIYDRTNNIYSLSLASEQMAQDDTLLLESDLILEPSILQSLVDDPRPNLALVAKYESWMDGTMVRIDSLISTNSLATSHATNTCLSSTLTPRRWATMNITKTFCALSRSSTATT